jgi:hypothetical protein
MRFRSLAGKGAASRTEQHTGDLVEWALWMTFSTAVDNEMSTGRRVSVSAGRFDELVIHSLSVIHRTEFGSSGKGWAQGTLRVASGGGSVPGL